MKVLEIKWTISNARDTPGYNICTLRDGDKKYCCLGGGYDMLGTVFGKWLWLNFADPILALPNPQGYYGLYFAGEHKYIDGACGLECMIKIAKAVGLDVHSHWNERTKSTVCFIITNYSQIKDKV